MAKGRFVAFSSDASNIVPHDRNGAVDIFVRDRETGRTERVSVGPDGVEGDGDSIEPAISASGRFVAFVSFASNLVPGDTNDASCGDPPFCGDVFVRDRATGRTERVSVGRRGRQANGDSTLPRISGDGGLVAFVSGATDLVPGDTNDGRDIFVRTR